MSAGSTTTLLARSIAMACQMELVSMKRSAGSKEYTSSKALRNVSMFHSAFQSLEGLSRRVRDEAILKPGLLADRCRQRP